MTEDHFLIRYESPLMQGNLIKQVEKIKYFDGIFSYAGHSPRLNFIANFNFNGDKITKSEYKKKILTIEENISSIEGISSTEHLGTLVLGYGKFGESLKVR